MRKSVEVNVLALKRLRSQPERVLSDLDRPVLDAAQRGMDQAQFLVPRGGAPDDPLNLADTSFVSVPHHNLGAPLSTTVTTGYDHPEAGSIHAGWHWGHLLIPPEWLRRAFKKGVRPLLIKGVSSQLMKSLAKLFPKK
ncbi:MAG TPA: hypothetical protein VFZ09_27585 [Archangium sp.]|uniref:hypothetical protein n=1 Tax=Archangium sp. TaxID=1872627 RepID=UPI002E2F3100|nr:hypothetical protein [Archangium sp.]HEX5750023.1 hypothetical protein [Archangium sp.]